MWESVVDLSAQHEEVNKLEVELDLSRPEEVIDDQEGRGLKRAMVVLIALGISLSAQAQRLG